MRELKFGTSWVRGVVGDALTPELLVDLASAFGTWVGGGPVVIGRDPRPSSQMLRSSVTSGLLAAGCEVIDLDITSTPLISFATRELGAAGGLSLTGSHNDARWNALKFIGPDGALLNSVKSEELLDIYHAVAFRRVPTSGLSAVGGEPDIAERYLEYLLSALDVEAIRARGLHVAVDFSSGTCGKLCTDFLAELGCRLTALNREPSRRFTHAPAPTAENMTTLASFLREVEADLGAAVNVDGDRIAFVTSSGEPLSEEFTLPLIAQNRLARRPGPVVTNLSTSWMIDRVAAEFGQTVSRTSVGEGYVVDAGLEEGAVLAGEGSGGVGALPVAMTFDALLNLGLHLESLATTGQSTDELIARIPRFSIRKGELPCSPDQVYRTLESFRSEFSDSTPDVTDGLRLEFDRSWLHVRASNTEPLVRVIVEAETVEGADRLFEHAMRQGRAATRGR